MLLSPFEKGWGPSFEQNWIYITRGCFVPSLLEISPVVLEKKIFEFCQYIFIQLLLSPLGKGHVLHLTKLEFPLLTAALYQVRLKLAQWFWRRRRKCAKLTTTKTMTTTTTDKGQIVIRKARLSLQLRWAKKLENKRSFSR